MSDEQLHASVLMAIKGAIRDNTNLESVSIENGAVKITLRVADDTPREARFALEDLISDAVEAVAGVTDVTISTLTVSGTDASEATKRAVAACGDHDAPHAHDSEPPPKLAGVGKVIAVASGKGGVGKSTIAVNLALALKQNGHKAGLLDVDIYGPSLTILLGTKPELKVIKDKIIPPTVFGLKVMSLGFLMQGDMPVIWRGPMVTAAIRQFLNDVDWSGLDYLIIDLPPGTGDAQITLAQAVPVDGVVIVSTPSDIALIDAARGLQMFKTLDIDVLGILENMSYFQCPHCNERTAIFGAGATQVEADRLHTRFLGEIPLDPQIREGGDRGHPVVHESPNESISAAFLELARTVADLKPNLPSHK